MLRNQVVIRQPDTSNARHSLYIRGQAGVERIYGRGKTNSHRPARVLMSCEFSVKINPDVERLRIAERREWCSL